MRKNPENENIKDEICRSGFEACDLVDPPVDVLGDPEVTANLYCNFAYLYWEGCAICSMNLQ